MDLLCAARSLLGSRREVFLTVTFKDYSLRKCTLLENARQEIIYLGDCHSSLSRIHLRRGCLLLPHIQWNIAMEQKKVTRDKTKPQERMAVHLVDYNDNSALPYIDQVHSSSTSFFCTILNIFEQLKTCDFMEEIWNACYTPACMK